MPNTPPPERTSVRHTIAIQSPQPAPGDSVLIQGDEAKHAVRVKRVRTGDRVRLLLGDGCVALTEVQEAGRQLQLTVLDAWTEQAPTPRIEVCSATPKGPRLEKMIDMLAQVGADHWQPMHTKYGVVDPRDTKLERAQRVAHESCKQCLRAHAMTIGESIDLNDALDAPEDVSLVIADASGRPYTQPGSSDESRPRCIRLLVGPEGGFTDEEVAMAAQAGAQIVNLGPHVLRIETACVLIAAYARNS